MGNETSAQMPLADLALQVRQDQRRCHLYGQSATVELLLAPHADLVSDELLVLDLVLGEILLRQKMGEFPDKEDYQARFSQYDSQIESMFAACELFDKLQNGELAEGEGETPVDQRDCDDGQRSTIEKQLETFRDAFSSSTLPEIREFASVESLRESAAQQLLLRELVMIDLEQRWRLARIQAITWGPAAHSHSPQNAPNRRPLLEDYFRDYADLLSSDEADVEMIVEEYRVRWRHGDRPQPDVYRQRFPKHGEDLSELLNCIRNIFVSTQQVSNQDLQETDALGTVAAHETSRGGTSAEGASDTGFAGAISKSTPYDPAAPLPFDDFELGKQIGAGGMGTVYRATQRSLDLQVAIKVLTRIGRRNDQAVQRFLREARSMAQMRHPNIVDIRGIGRTPDGGYFMVMDYIDGPDLQKLIISGNAGTSMLAQMATIADTIHHAHQRGVIHRDLKPSNILVNREGKVLVTDFGLAKLLDAEDSQLSLASEPLGTPSYMAPEQATKRWGEVSARTDVYGLGGILYALLTGEPPFRGQSHFEVLAQVASDDNPTRPSRVRADISPTLEQICMKCLSKDPSERYASARDVAEAIRGWCITANIGVPDDNDEAAVPMPTEQAEVAASSNRTAGSSPPLGAMPLDSEFYLVREADFEFESALTRQDSIVLIRGARQMGKTSLLARGLMQARDLGLTVVLIDMQKLQSTDLQTPDRLYCALGEWIANEMDLDVYPDDSWDSRRSASVNFERYIRREVLKGIDVGLVMGLDEVDRLFECPFRSEVFGLFRSWHNARALQPTGPWSRMTLAMAYATEAHLFITDPNQSPFNVGTLIAMDDFSAEQVAVLNDRYGLPLKDESELERFNQIVSGQPYLVNRGLYELALRSMSIAEFEERADQEMGFYGDHLRHLMSLLSHQPQLRDVFAQVLTGYPCPSVESFYQLRSAGYVSGDYAAQAKPRCQLYANYFKRHLS